MLPILALDVDGPIAIFGDHHPQDVIELMAGDIPITISKTLKSHLEVLSRHFQVVWSTSWCASASRHLAPLLGLPVGLPFIPFDKYPKPKRGESRKLPALKAWLKDYPVAIVDDEIGTDLVTWAKSRSARTLLIEIDPREGLTSAHVEQLLQFASVL